ncbi:MAG: hypothetical protein ACYTHK_10130 [Planctomycetota bacterium]|jgi:hypothetical protein
MSNLKKPFLRALVGSVGLSAVMSIFAILAGDLGWFELRILLTSTTIAVASISGLACGACAATGRLLPRAGIAVTVGAALMVIAGVWAEPDSEAYWKLAVCASVYAVACAHVSLLSTARLQDSHRWLLVAARVVIFATATLIGGMLVFEADGEGLFRLLGVGAVVAAALTVLIPILHRLSPARIDAEIARLRERLARLEEQKRRNERSPAPGGGGEFAGCRGPA